MNSMPIIDFLKHLKYDYENLVHEFIRIGDLTAVRHTKDGTMYRRNYERGILLCALCDVLGLKNVLEIGTGRGYVSSCLRNFCQTDRIVTVDRQPPDEAKSLISQAIGSANGIEFITADANKLTNEIDGVFDLFFIDGQHDGFSVKKNYEYCKTLADQNFVVVFDDYRNKFPSIKKAINKMETELSSPYLVHTDGWIIKNKCINFVGDADKVADNKEYGSGLVVSIKHENYTQ